MAGVSTRFSRSDATAFAAAAARGTTDRGSELENVLARVQAGVWRKRNPPPPVAAGRVPTFHEYASAWLEAKIDGLLGD
jgi:hypothetical protein